MELGPSSSRSGSLRIEGFQVAQSGDSAFAHLVTTPAARKPAADSPFSRLLKADSAPQGGPRGGLKLKLPPRALKTAASTAAPSAPSAEPTPSVQCLRKAQSCGLGGMPALWPASSAPVPVPTAGSCRRVPGVVAITTAVMSGTWQMVPAYCEACCLRATPVARGQGRTLGSAVAGTGMHCAMEPNV